MELICRQYEQMKDILKEDEDTENDELRLQITFIPIEKRNNYWIEYKTDIELPEWTDRGTIQDDKAERCQLVYWDKEKTISKGRQLRTETIVIKKEKNYMLARYKRCVEMLKQEMVRNRIVQKLVLNSKEYNNSPIYLDNVNDIPTFSNNEIVAINGVPGSGKSTLAANIIDRAHDKFTSIYMSPTHQQLKCMAYKLKNKNLRFTIMSDEAKLDAALTQYHHSNEKGYTEKKKNIIPTSAKIVLTTVNKPLKNLSRAKLDLILIDESTKVTVLEAITAIYELQPARVLITLGDIQQLGSSTEKGQPMKDILEYCQERKFRTMRINKQYRFGQEINQFPSRLFYKNEMESATNKNSVIKMFEISTCQHTKEDKFGCVREAEICNNLQRIFKAQIITPYSKQAEIIVQNGGSEEVLTIDKAQGSEFDNVILSIGRNNGRGFLSKKRLNVGMTRAKYLLIIVIHSETLKTISELSYIGSQLEKNGRKIVI